MRQWQLNLYGLWRRNLLPIRLKLYEGVSCWVLLPLGELNLQCVRHRHVLIGVGVELHGMSFRAL